MCFPADAVPPIAPVHGAAVTHRHLELSAADGTELAVFEARSEVDGAPGIVILPDVRGLFVFYEELALRFAEIGVDAVAIDYFGRTAPKPPRPADFEWKDHIPLTTADGVRDDVAAAVALLRADDPDRRVFTVGFCFGGSNSWSQAANGHGLTGVIGVYGNPTRADVPLGARPVVDRVGEMECPLLALMAGDDPGIPPDAVSALDEALTGAGVDHEVITYPGAPHSFFDRTYEQHAEASADAWERVQQFVKTHA